ncbi:MAG: 23S rRNA (pseudouridine(1915)-N(3))-methyltransferase RlmH [Candidatus Izemoplasmataceae bacterium]
MQIDIICVGQIKERYFNEAIKEYLKRLSRYASLKIIEVKEAKEPKNASNKDILNMLEEEAKAILNQINDAYVIALAIEGKSLSSISLKEKIDDIITYQNSHLAFIIGSSYGLSETIKKRSDFLLSFSKATFPHQLMRVILLEQLYRVMRINNNEPYHK